MGSNCNCRVLVAEVESNTLDEVVRNLVAAGCRVITASDGEEALEKARRLGPELLVLDYVLPSLSGAAVLRALKEDPQTAGISVITLTASDSDVDRIVCLELGADDCLSKPFNPRELVLRAKGMIGRRTPKAPEISGCIEMNDTIHEVKVAGRAVDLTPVEYKLLRLLLSRPGQVFSRTEMLDGVWGCEFVIGRRTIDTHLRRLRVKLGRAANQIETIRGFGYRLCRTA